MLTSVSRTTKFSFDNGKLLIIRGGFVLIETTGQQWPSDGQLCVGRKEKTIRTATEICSQFPPATILITFSTINKQESRL